MRGDITKFILEFLAETAANSVDIIDTILSSGYGASVGKMHRVSRELRIAITCDSKVLSRKQKGKTANYSRLRVEDCNV